MMFRLFIGLCAGLAAGVVSMAGAHAESPALPLPPLPAAGQADFRDYWKADENAAFAIAPDGAWAWVAGQPSIAQAREEAIAACQFHSSLRCIVYAEDRRIVFDRREWISSWGPYASAAQAKNASIGHERGQRMIDLSFVNPGGRQLNVAALKGKVLILHFWGSWCPHCRKEMPEFEKLYKAMANRSDVVFISLQARENITVSRRWADQHNLRLPLYDSGCEGENDLQFRTSGNGRIADREVASLFPTTYVVDKRGMIVFSHSGLIMDWLQYRDFIVDVADRSGR